MAGGLELALVCDIRILEENAILGVFCRRFGVPLTGGDYFIGLIDERFSFCKRTTHVLPKL